MSYCCPTSAAPRWKPERRWRRSRLKTRLTFCQAALHAARSGFKSDEKPELSPRSGPVNLRPVFLKRARCRERGLLQSLLHYNYNEESIVAFCLVAIFRETLCQNRRYRRKRNDFTVALWRL